MESASKANRSPARGASLDRVLVYALLFVSGFAALSYEASWSRLVGLVLGNTAESAAIVLAAFFSGMALGQLLFGMFAPRRPLLAFGLAELSTAFWAVAVPQLLDRVDRGGAASRPLGCFLVLLPATTAMGATLPLIVDVLMARRVGKRHVSAIYAVNTLGGLIGIIAATAFLLVVLGVRTSSHFAAGLSAICGIAALLRDCASPVSCTPDASERGSELAPPVWSWAGLAALSGLVTMALEVLFTRMFGLVFHNSIYTFGAILAASLLALTLGAIASGFLKRWVRDDFTLAAGALLGSAVTLSLSIYVFWQVTGLAYFSAGESFRGYLAASLGLVALVVLPPITCLGVVFPTALGALAGASRVGWVAAANTLAGAAGAILAGFTLPTHFGLWASFGVCSAVIGITGSALLFSRSRSLAGLAAVGVVLLAFFSGKMPKYSPPGTELVQRWECAYGWIDVVRSTSTDAIQLRQNLHYQHGSTTTAVREYRQGRLPLALHPRPRDVAFLGLGTGHTAAPVVVDPEVQSAVIVELIPQVVEAARLLSSTNMGVVDNPKVEIQLDDARSFLKRTPRKFDVIVSDLYVPWENRAAYLYSVDFYEAARKRLRPRGLFCQWLALYQVGEDEFQLIADSFASVFPETTVWWGQLDSRYPIVAFIGSERPRVVYQNLLEKRLEDQEGLPGGQDPDLYLAQDLADLFLGSWEKSPRGRLNSDEHPWLELTAPLSHRDDRTLHGRLFRDFFDTKLSRLPNKGVEFVGAIQDRLEDVTRRRAAQRLSLFGDVADEDSGKKQHKEGSRRMP